MPYIGGTWLEQENLEQALERIVKWLNPYIKINGDTTYNEIVIKSAVLQQPELEWHKKFKETINGEEIEFPCAIRCYRYVRTIFPEDRECQFIVLYNHEYGIVQWSMQDTFLITEK